MHHQQKAPLRAAVLIHEQLVRRGIEANSLRLPEYLWESVQRLRRQMQRAQERGWHRAAKRLADELAYALQRLQAELETAAHAVQAHAQPRSLPSPAEIYRDILALDEEFPAAGIDLRQHEVFVTTEKIELEDIYLGAFEIRLDWQRMGCP